MAKNSSGRTTSELLIGIELQEAAKKIDECQTNFGADGRQDLINNTMSVMEAACILFSKGEFSDEREEKLLVGIADALANLQVGALNTAVCAHQRYCDYSKKNDVAAEDGKEPPIGPIDVQVVDP